MVVEWGGREFVVDYDTDFIMNEFCYYNGLNCLNCSEYDSCSEELDFVMEQLRNQNV